MKLHAKLRLRMYRLKTNAPSESPKVSPRSKAIGMAILYSSSIGILAITAFLWWKRQERERWQESAVEKHGMYYGVLVDIHNCAMKMQIRSGTCAFVPIIKILLSSAQADHFTYIISVAE